MEDQTTLFLLSALIQGVATIWGLSMVAYFWFLKEFFNIFEITENKHFSTIGDVYAHIYMGIYNITIILAIIFGILSLFYYKIDILIVITVILSIISIVLIAIFFIFMIFMYAIITYEEVSSKGDEGGEIGGI